MLQRKFDTSLFKLAVFNLISLRINLYEYQISHIANSIYYIYYIKHVIHIDSKQYFKTRKLWHGFHLTFLESHTYR